MKLEEGKIYIDYRGFVHGPMKKNISEYTERATGYYDGNKSFREDGTSYGRKDPLTQLISEYEPHAH